MIRFKIKCVKSTKIRMVLFLICLGSVVLSVNAQDEILLRIGDQAPPMKYSKWLKGEPVESFKGDQLYVLEFWATWCGPCKAAMPHLTKTQKEYGDKIRIIGVDVWEHHGDEEKPYDAYLPAVEKFVRGNEANMGYAVVADNNEQHMGNNWLKAAGQNGIPSTFIVKEGKIIWIGHPIKLDSTLQLIMNGSYNMQEYKTAFDKRVEASQKQSAGMRAAMEPVTAALKAKDYRKAFEMMEKAKEAQPILKISMDNMKFTTLLKYVSEKEAIAFAEQWKKDFDGAPGYALQAVAGENELSKDTYLWALKNFEANNTRPVNPLMYNLIASVYAKAGDYQSAIRNQEKAVADAKTALKQGELVGSIMDYTVAEFEESLGNYKAKAAKH